FLSTFRPLFSTSSRPLRFLWLRELIGCRDPLVELLWRTLRIKCGPACQPQTALNPDTQHKLWRRFPSSVPAMSSHVNTDLEQELGDLLQEFQDVVEELKAPPQSKPHAYQRVLQEAKSRMGRVTTAEWRTLTTPSWETQGNLRVLSTCWTGNLLKCEQREIASHVEGRVMGRGAGRLGATWLATAEQRGRSTPERI
ncbi:hypothetical protein INR49_024864, partial [Caranx melampygus]